MKVFRNLLAVLLIMAPVCAHAVNAREYRLDNGLKLLIVEDHKAPTATFQVWYRVGSRDENIGETGLSHLLEHMMFKGTSTRGPKTFSQAIQRAGGWDNAFTTREYTAYFEMISSDRIGLPISLEADRMRNLVLTPAAVLSERDVVMEERRLRYEDDPQNLLFMEVLAAAFNSHPYRWPVIGWKSDLKTLKPAELASYYRTYYAPNNAVIIVVGDVKPEEVLSAVRKSFGEIPRGPAIAESAAGEDEQYGEKRIYIRKEAELPAVLSVYKVPGIRDEDAYALDVLATVLSEGKSSRIYRSIVYDKQLALSAWASYEGMYRDPFLFMTGGTAAGGKNIEDVEKAILDEIERIKKEPPSGREVQKAKNQIEASFVMGQDSIYMQARMIGAFEMIGGWRLLDTYLEGIRKVSPEEVSRVARKYLVPERKTTGILIPLKKGAGL
ncbi:MAG: pitrilysin family protein [Candidatus Sulfobium sp.]|jgi:zinc protease